MCYRSTAARTALRSVARQSWAVSAGWDVGVPVRDSRDAAHTPVTCRRTRVASRVAWTRPDPPPATVSRQNPSAGTSSYQLSNRGAGDQLVLCAVVRVRGISVPPGPLLSLKGISAFRTHCGTSEACGCLRGTRVPRRHLKGWQREVCNPSSKDQSPC